MTDVLVIEDDAGNRTEFAWPQGATILHNAAFADLCVAAFEIALTEEPLA